MSMVRLLAFETLGCGCLAGHYRDVGTERAVTYIEEKAGVCLVTTHRRNHAVPPRPVRGRGFAPRAPAASPFRHT